MEDQATEAQASPGTGTQRVIIDQRALNDIKSRAVQHFHDDPGGEDMIHRCLFRALADYVEHQGAAVTFEVKL